MDSLGFLTGISPWWWVAAALALGAVEMMTMSFFLIWPALAALAIAGVLAVAPGLSGLMQVALFAILSMVATLAGRVALDRYGDGDESKPDALNRRTTYCIGKTGSVIDFAAGEGNVEVSGTRWRARWQNGNSARPGDTVRVTGADGMTLIVSALDS